MRRLVLPVAAAALLGVGPFVSEAAESVDLDGSWHVLVHYTDSSSNKPGQVRWDDRVWMFERKGSDLVWTEYPLVVFSDDTGRFERSRGYHRVLGAWEPTPVQRAQIENGLQVNDRGSNTKRLRGSDQTGWRSGAKGGPSAGNVISYTETWSVEGLPGLPIFVKTDSLSGGMADDAGYEGGSRYVTEAVEDGGAVLRGRFERDGGTRKGTFRMQRSGAVSKVVAGDMTPNQKAAQRLQEVLLSGEASKALLRNRVRDSALAKEVDLTDGQVEEIVREVEPLLAQSAPDEAIDEAIEAAVEKQRK
jgi:hypothetical protein